MDTRIGVAVEEEVVEEEEEEKGDDARRRHRLGHVQQHTLQIMLPVVVAWQALPIGQRATQRSTHFVLTTWSKLFQNQFYNIYFTGGESGQEPVRMSNVSASKRKRKKKTTRSNIYFPREFLQNYNKL